MNYKDQKPLVQGELFDRELERLDEAVNATLGMAAFRSGYLILPSGMFSFRQTTAARMVQGETNIGSRSNPRMIQTYTYCIEGELREYDPEAQYICPACSSPMTHNSPAKCELQHLPFGANYTRLSITRQRLLCTNKDCRQPFTFPIPFKDPDHMITLALRDYIEHQLMLGYTLKKIYGMTNVHTSTIKDIDLKRLRELYTVNGEGKELKKPEQYARALGVDEVMIHHGHQYATIIIDMDSGAILWAVHTKTKDVIYRFIEHVGQEWMSHVQVICSDMNADFGAAFQERCPHLSIVYDRFHIVKNFNEKVISEVRKDEQRRLIKEGNEEAAEHLKNSKYILMTSEKTRARKEKDAKNGKVISRGSNILDRSPVIQQPGITTRYKDLIKENELLFTIDLIKEELQAAYEKKYPAVIKRYIDRIIGLCRETENKHFLWFASLLENHMDGIISHAKYQLTSGKMEGTNRMIQQVRSDAYGFSDDDYFFLKIIDRSYVGIKKPH